MLNYVLSPGSEKAVDFANNLIKLSDLPNEMWSAGGKRPTSCQGISFGVEVPAPHLAREFRRKSLSRAMASNPVRLCSCTAMPH